MMTTRQAALALLNDHAATLTERAGQFLGHMAVSANPMTERQARWMRKLLDAAGLPPLADGGEQ